MTPLDLDKTLEVYALEASLIGAGVTSACLPAEVVVTEIGRCETRGARTMLKVPDRLHGGITVSLTANFFLIARLFARSQNLRISPMRSGCIMSRSLHHGAQMFNTAFSTVITSISLNVKLILQLSSTYADRRRLWPTSIRCTVIVVLSSARPLKDVQAAGD